MLDTSSDKALNPLDFFRLKIEESSSAVSKANMLRAVDALSGFIGGADISFDSFNDNLIGEFVAQLLFDGYTPKTISNNIIKRLATLYNKAVEAGLAHPTDVFKAYKEKLDKFQQHELSYTSKSEVFNKIQKIIRTDYSGDPQLRLGKDILLFALYNGGLTFEQIADYRKDDYNGGNSPISGIVARYAKPRTKYLFPLNQAHSTPKQAHRLIQGLLANILNRVHLSLSAIPAYTVLDLWCAIALSCGVSASDIASCLSASKAAPAITTFVKPSGINEEETARIRESIIETLTDNPINWYVMHFRPRVSYDMIKDRLKDRDISLVEAYYPMEDVIRKVGGKKVFESRPVISWLLFFRERVTELNRLYHEIGDLAWGYRRSKAVSSQYATINRSEIQKYKIAIGDFGEDTRLYPEGALRLQPGDRLVVLGGLLSGRTGTFESMKKSEGDGGRLICRILLDGGHYKDWIADQDIRLVKKIND